MASLTELEYSGSLPASTLLYAVLDHEGSPLSRSTSLLDLENWLPNKINTAANLGTGIPVFRERSATSLNFRSLVAGDGMNIASATSTITITSGSPEKQATATIGASNTWNNELIPLFQGPIASSGTIVEILATTSGTNDPGLSFNLQHRDWGQLTNASAGIDIFAASQTATSAGEQFTTFARASLDPRAHLMFTTGSGAESGSVNYVQISVFYTML